MVNIGRKLDLSHALTTASSEDQVYYERLAMEKGWLIPTPDAISNILVPTSLAKEYIYDYMNNLISENELNEGLDMLAKRNNRKQKNICCNNLSRNNTTSASPIQRSMHKTISLPCTKT